MKKLYVLALGLALFAAHPAQAVNMEAVGAPSDIVAAPATPANAPGDCVDDPRLPELPLLLESGKPLNPPLTLTAETYFTLDTELAGQLAGQLILCPNIRVMKNGKPAQKVMADFDTLWRYVITLAIQGDTAKLDALRASFIARPLPPEGVVRLAANPGLEEGTLKSIRMALKTPVIIKEYPTLLEFYVALGGRSTERVDVCVAYTERTIPSLEKLKMHNAYALITGIVVYENFVPVVTNAGMNGLTSGLCNQKYGN